LHRVLRPGGRLVMALFGERTLHELRASHAAALGGRPSHTQGFPDREQLGAALGPGFCVELLESQMEQEWHADVSQLLKGLKAIGAQNASRSRPAGLASRRAMAEMFEVYTREFAVDGKIPATYEVLYLRARRITA
jgi:malonyl-CoA O-methyltransferase